MNQARRRLVLCALAVAGTAEAAEPAMEDLEPALPDSAELGYAPPSMSPAWIFGGYVDVGFAHAQGDGTSFAPDDQRLPADYGVDPFATAVNTRGEVASTDSGGRFTNGFLPRSLGLGGKPSVFVNTASFDVRYESPASPLMVFSRVHLLPRREAHGSDTRVVLDQAFGRLAPWDSVELALTVGKLDSVFGVEYLEREAPLRTGITPSLIARYTTGTPVGAKVFYRLQLPGLLSALSVNVAATSSAPFVEALQPPEVSLTGRPVGSGRVGWELNLRHVQLKVGGSGMLGPRNDQGDPRALQRALGADMRVILFGLSVSAEGLWLEQDPGSAVDKRTGLGPQTIASGFRTRGGYLQASYDLPWSAGPLRKATLHGHIGQRHAQFDGFAEVVVRRFTGGLRLDLWENLAIKGEYLINRELRGAPSVDNDVLAASAVFVY